MEIAVRNITRRKRRSWLTIIGILIGIAAVVSLVSIGQGLQESVTEQFEQIGSDKLFINPGGDQTQGQVTTSIKLTEDDLQVVRSTKGVDDAVGTLFMTTPASYKGEEGFISLLGTPAGEKVEIVQNSWAIKIEEGRMIRQNDRSSMVIGSQIASGLYEDDPGLRSKLEIQGEEFRVAGIMEPTGDPSIDGAVVMQIDAAQKITGRDDGSYDWVFARMEPGFSPSEVQDDVERGLRNSRNVEEGEEDFTVSTQEDLLDSFNQILGVVRGVVIGIASISIVVGAVNIMNTMYTSVTERTREIGVLKAIGATRKQIMLVFLLESGVIGLVGGLMGVVLGLAMSFSAAHLATQATNIAISAYADPALIAGALLFSFLTGTVAGVFPARSAAKLHPADALRYE